MRIGRLTHITAALMTAACASDSGPSGPRDEAAPGPGGGAAPVTGMLASGAVPRSLVPSAPGTVGSLVYVAATPASFPGAKHARLVSSRGDSAFARAFDGGFDPLPVRAENGDVVTVTVVDSADRETTTSLPARAKPPRVVRTSPAANRTDVPLNLRVTVVFSTPMDSASVIGSVSLLAQGVEIPGTVELEPNALAAHFTPLAPLVANSDYELRVASGVRDVLGAPLGEQIGVPFRTNADLGSPAPLRVAITVSGEDQDLIYSLKDLGDCWDGGGVFPDSCTWHDVRAGSSALDLAPGTRTFQLQAVAANCAVRGGEAREVTIVAGATVEIGFDVTCAALPPVSLRVRAKATGVPVPSYYYAETGDHGECNTGRCSLSWEAAESYELRAFPGVREVRLRTPRFCRVEGQNPAVVNVAEGAVADVLFQVACTPPGYVRVELATSGSIIADDAGFGVRTVAPCGEGWDSCFSGWVSNRRSFLSDGLRAGNTIDIYLEPSTYMDDQADCRVTSANPVRFTPQSNRLGVVSFAVTCE